MKILSLHCDFLKYKPLKKALQKIEELAGEEKKAKEIKEPLVILTSVEKGDTDAKGLVENIKDIANQVKAKTIVLYPYAHLSSNLAAPELAVKILKEAEELLKKAKYAVTRAPFGYYKEFELKCKGHPLAELSRSIGINSKEIEASKKLGALGAEKPFTENDRAVLLKSMTKQNTTFEKSKEGLKGNAEIGRELDLFVGSEVVGSGLPLFTPKGATIKREIERFVIDEELKNGYLHTDTPDMAKSDMYKISGHWQHYKDSMFTLMIGKEEFALRPMTCPFQFIIYKSKPRSYKELPIKYAEMSDLFRNEQSGELMGLTRLRQFTLSDAHIICKPEQLEDEFAEVLKFIKSMMNILQIKEFWYRFSKGDIKDKSGKYIDNPKAWIESEKSMKKILDKLKLKYIEIADEAAFYGPKLDIQTKNIFGKEDTLITIQIDFALPEKFDLTYIDEKGQSKRPMVIHRSSVGCIERTMAYLLEKTQGNLATWLAPVQARVLSFTERNVKAVQKFAEELKEKGVRVEINSEEAPMGGRIRQAELQKIPYIIVIGDKEQKKKELAVRHDGKVKNIKTEKFVKTLLKEIADKK